MPFLPWSGGGTGVQQPWQFTPEAYGALGNGRLVGDGAMTTGTAVLTSASANFSSADVGKHIVVNGALGSSNAPLYATIQGVTSSTTATLSANATNTISAAAAFWATDDSAAFQAAMAAGSAYAQANNWKFQLVLSAKWYGLATLFTTAAGGSLAAQNALVPIPYPNVNGTTQKLSVDIVGVWELADEQYFQSTIPSMTGTALVAMVAASGSQPSIVGGPNAATNLTGTWANTKVNVRGVTVWCGFNPGWVGWDLGQMSACWVDNAGAQILAPNGGGQNPGLGVIPINTLGYGFIFPANNDAGAGRVMSEGFYQGVAVSPRTTIEKLFTNANAVAMQCRTVNATVTHGCHIGYWSLQHATTAITTPGTSGTFPLVIDFYDAASPVTTDLTDPNGIIAGTVNWHNNAQTAPVVGAGAILKFFNLQLAPGHWTGAPAAPGSGTAQQNTAWRDATVYMSASTGITVVVVDSTTTGLVAASGVTIAVPVPSGHSFTVTYTGTLTTTWVLS